MGFLKKLGIRFSVTTCPHCGKLTDYYADTCDNCGRVFK